MQMALSCADSHITHVSYVEFPKISRRTQIVKLRTTKLKNFNSCISEESNIKFNQILLKDAKY